MRTVIPARQHKRTVIKHIAGVGRIVPAVRMHKLFAQWVIRRERGEAEKIRTRPLELHFEPIIIERAYAELLDGYFTSIDALGILEWK